MKYFVVFLITFSLFAIPLNPQESTACSCIKQTPEQSIKESTAIFSGTVIKTSEKHPSWPIISGIDPVIVEFQVDKVWKGPVADTVTIQTAHDSAACGYNFEDEKSYLVYSYSILEYDPLVVEASLCSRTQLIENAAEDLAALEAITIPNDSPLKQQKNGVPANEVKCKEGFYRGISKSTDKAVCVTGYTLNELIHREWAHPHTSISSSTVSGTGDVINEYCPEGAELLQGGWYSTKRNPPVQEVSTKQIYDPQYDSQGIEITFDFLEDSQTYGKSMIFAFVDCDTSFETFEIIILPNSVEKRKNFVVYYPSGFDNTIHFVNQDNIAYQIDGIGNNNHFEFSMLLDAKDDWHIEETQNMYDGIESVSLSASNPDTGEVYDWMNYILYPKHVESKQSEHTTEDETNQYGARYEKYLDENNELNFGLQYDKNGIIIDDLQRIFDWCDFTGKKPDGWYFDWNNSTHHIDSENCKWVENEN